MNEDLVEIMQLCVCGDPAYCHAHRPPNKKGERLRGACTHGDTKDGVVKVCGCKKFEAAP